MVKAILEAVIETGRHPKIGLAVSTEAFETCGLYRDILATNLRALKKADVLRIFKAGRGHRYRLLFLPITTQRTLGLTPEDILVNEGLRVAVVRQAKAIAASLLCGEF